MVSQVPSGSLLKQTEPNGAPRALPGGREGFLNALNGGPSAVAETQALLAKLGQTQGVLTNLTQEILAGTLPSSQRQPLAEAVAQFTSDVLQIRGGETAESKIEGKRVGAFPQDATEARVPTASLEGKGAPRTVLAAGGVNYRLVPANRGPASTKA